MAATVEFTPDAAEGTQTVELSFDSTGLGGHRLVVFEKLLEVKALSLPCTRTSRTRASPSRWSRSGPRSSTPPTATTWSRTGRSASWTPSSTKGFVAGETYTVHGTIMDKATGLALEDSEGNPVTSTAEFVAEGSNGTVE